MTGGNKILVGKIVAPQGVRGEVRVQTYTAHPMDLQKMQIHSNRFAVGDFSVVRRLNPTSEVIVARVRGFDDRTAVEALRGTELYVERGALPVLKDDGEYYQADLIGFTVMRGDAVLGILDGFQNFGAGDIMELSNGDMVSFIGADVDMENKIIRV